MSETVTAAIMPDIGRIMKTKEQAKQRRIARAMKRAGSDPWAAVKRKATRQQSQQQTN